MADAGKAMMLYKGVYDSTIEYEILDVVNYNGSLYISKINNNLDYEPTLDETKWQLFLEGGTSENIKITDTQGIVGNAGSSSFVQTLLDGIAEKVVNIISGSEVVKKATQAETATKATQDGDGNVITQQYFIGKTITDSMDFNNMKTSGIYHMKGVNDTNKPTDGNGTLIVEFDVGTPYQLWMQDNHYYMYKRTYSNSVWSEWSKMEAGNAETATNAINDTSGRNIAEFLGRINGTTWGAAELYSGDLDDIVVQSIYNVNGTTDLHSPVNAWGFVLTFIHNYIADTHRCQVWIGMTTGLMYWRYKSGVWSEWKVITQNTQILNTATAIEASTSSGNIVGVQGLKEYLEANYVHK